MKYKVWSEIPAHLWDFENLKEEMKATLFDYKLRGNNIIDYIIYETKQPVDPIIFKKHKFKYKVVV